MAASVDARPIAAKARGVPLWARALGIQSSMKAREVMWGYIFLLPWILGLVIFILGPILASAYFSLTQYSIVKPPQFVGAENYVRPGMQFFKQVESLCGQDNIHLNRMVARR